MAQSSVGDRHRIREDRPRALVGVQRDAVLPQRRQHRREQPIGGARIDQQGLEGVADARPLHLGVDGDLGRHRGIRARVEIEVHHAGAGLDHRDLRFAHDRVDEGGAPARDQHVDETARLHQRGRSVAPELVDGLHGVAREADALERILEQADQHAIGVLGGAPSAQHDGVAALQRECGDVDRDVGARLVDGSDHAERHPHLGQAQPVGERRAAHHLTHRIRQRDHLAHGGGETGKAGRVESEAVLQPGAQSRSHDRWRGRARSPEG